jgi:hypothetical protein
MIGTIQGIVARDVQPNQNKQVGRAADPVNFGREIMTRFKNEKMCMVSKGGG